MHHWRLQWKGEVSFFAADPLPLLNILERILERWQTWCRVREWWTLFNRDVSPSCCCWADRQWFHMFQFPIEWQKISIRIMYYRPRWCSTTRRLVKKSQKIIILFCIQETELFRKVSNILMCSTNSFKWQKRQFKISWWKMIEMSSFWTLLLFPAEKAAAIRLFAFNLPRLPTCPPLPKTIILIFLKL